MQKYVAITLCLALIAFSILAVVQDLIFFSQFTQVTAVTYFFLKG